MPDALKYLCGKASISLKEFEELFPDTTPQLEIDRLDAAWESHANSVLTFLVAQDLVSSQRQYLFAGTAYGSTPDNALRHQGVIYGLKEAAGAFTAAKTHYRAILEKLIAEVYARDHASEAPVVKRIPKTGTRDDV